MRHIAEEKQPSAGERGTLFTDWDYFYFAIYFGALAAFAICALLGVVG
jgi:hypothetical protein